MQAQRHHARTDWHLYNIKQKSLRKPAVREADFERLIDDLDESISGSESSGDEDEPDLLQALLRKQARRDGPDQDEEEMDGKRYSGSPILWFMSSLLPSHTRLGVYRNLFTPQELVNPPVALKRQQIAPAATIFLCMLGGGHFAGMVVSVAPKRRGKEFDMREATVLAHKTFHRYTTRRKQGGSQSSSDAAKGAAHSAGSTLRRYNELALEQEIRGLLNSWRHLIDDAKLAFVRATGTANKRLLFGPYDGQVLHRQDERLRSFPFNTRRATQAELMRAFVELTRVKVYQIDEIALAKTAALEEAQKISASKAKEAAKIQPVAVKATVEEEQAAFHTKQIQALIRRSKVPALMTYLQTNDIPANFRFSPSLESCRAPTALHFAASIGSPSVVICLLTKCEADPCLRNVDGKTAVEIAADRSTRDAFRIGRHLLGEDRWSWIESRIGSALSREEVEGREKEERDAAAAVESTRRALEEQRLRQEGPSAKEGKITKVADLQSKKTAQEKREEQSRGMTPEMRMRMEREKRARAAEARFQRR